MVVDSGSVTRRRRLTVIIGTGRMRRKYAPGAGSAIRIGLPCPEHGGPTMSILVQYHPKNLTAEQYDNVVQREEATATYPPDGREYHVCFGTDGDLHVSEIWNSLAQLQAYGEILMPMLADAGVEFSAEPEIFDVHRID
jgi:hypothetical protein